jgi:hypothetical protein
MAGVFEALPGLTLTLPSVFDSIQSVLIEVHRMLRQVSRSQNTRMEGRNGYENRCGKQ